MMPLRGSLVMGVLAGGLLAFGLAWTVLGAISGGAR